MWWFLPDPGRLQPCPAHYLRKVVAVCHPVNWQHSQDEETPITTLTEVPEELISATEAAKLFGISRQRLDEISRKDATFPKPVMVGRTRVFDRQAVIAWAQAKGREIQWRPPQTSS